MNEDMKKVAKFLSGKIESAKEEILEYIDMKLSELESLEAEPEEDESDPLGELDEADADTESDADLDGIDNYQGKRKLIQPKVVPAQEEKPKKSFFGKKKDAVIQ